MITAYFIHRIFLPVLMVLTFLSCKDEDDLDLPPLTREGKMTFGCKIDGKKFLPGGMWGGVKSENDGLGWGYVSGSNSNTKNEVTIIIIHPGYSLKEDVRYEFDQGKIHCEYYSYGGEKTCDFRELPVSGGIVFTRIDSVNGIASGTFEFEAYSSSCQKTVSVTEGRFDVKI